MKGSIRIVGALVLGVFIVLGALYASTSGAIKVGQEGAIVAAVDHDRTYIQSQDTDGDGIKDWEEDLRERFVNSFESASTTAADPNTPYEPPTTLTGKFSEAFLQDYLEGKINGADYSDPSSFLEGAVEAIGQNTQSKKYSRLELSVTPSGSLYDYGNTVASVIKKHSIENENEAAILQRALDANDPSILRDLIPIRTVYENLIADSLRMEVSENIVNEHVALLNAYEAVLTDIRAMELAFTDPLYALARVRGYESDAQALLNSLQAIGRALENNGTSYLNEEPGALFYRFKP